MTYLLSSGSNQMFEQKLNINPQPNVLLANESLFLSSFVRSHLIRNNDICKILNSSLLFPISKISFGRESNDLFQSSNMFRIRPFSRADKPSIIRLLSILPKLYPGGANWLDQRLDDVIYRKARCQLAVTKWGQPIGVTIETPKEAYRLKLSTIYVHPSFRGLGVGTALLSNCHANWLREELRRVYVTVDLNISDTLYTNIGKFGFRLKAFVPDRYGNGRNEVIFDWCPE